MNNVSKAVLFSIVVLGIASWMGIVLQVRDEIYMFAPAIAAAVMLLLTGDAFKRAAWRELGLLRFGLRKWPFAIVIPIVVMSIVTIVLWATPYASVRIQEEVTGAALWLLPLKILFLLVYYTITSALGEELGWRGYLLPKFADLGWGKAFLLSGTVHALFHFPLIFTGRYHSEGNPWIVIPMFVFSLLLIGVIFGYIRMATQSVWPAAIMHAMHNIAMAFYREFTEVTSPAMSEYIGSESGIAAILLYGAIAVWIMTKMKRNNDAEQLMPAKKSKVG